MSISAHARTKLASWIACVGSLDPEAPELEFEGQWRSWRELTDASAALLVLLDEAGIPAGTRIGVLLRNRGAIVPVLLALFTGDRCLASINAAAPDDKLADDVRRATVPVLVALEEDWQRPGIREAAAETGVIGIVLAGDGTVRLLDGLPGDPALWTNPSAEGVAIEMLSSGTTGTPKRIPLSARKFEHALIGAAGFEKGRDGMSDFRLRSGVQIVFAPLAHIAGITGLMNNLLAGRKICLVERFTVDAFRDAVSRHSPKVVTAPPAALRMVLDADIPAEELSSLTAWRSGTAPLDPDHADAMYERYGIPVLQNYGATEFAGGVAGWTMDDFKAHRKDKRGSVGRVNKGIEARIVDPETGDELPAGDTGLLELRGGNVAAGGEWTRTNDLASLDADNFLWIRGRHDGAIIRGGFKILPDDVIRAMELHPAIREAAVTGVADARLGQVPVAAYVAKRGCVSPSDEDLKAFLKERLMPYQVPVRILQLDDFPRTPSMKVSQPALKELFEAAG